MASKLLASRLAQPLRDRSVRARQARRAPRWCFWSAESLSRVTRPARFAASFAAAPQAMLLARCKHPVYPPGQLRRLLARSAWPPAQLAGALPAADFHSRGVSVEGAALSTMRCSTSFRWAQGSIPSRPQLFTSE